MCGRGVVDLLEAVEVDEQDGELRVAGGERLFDRCAEECPVGEVGERVVERLVLDHVHLATKASRDTAQDGEERDVETEKHQLEDGDDREVRTMRCRSDGRVVLGEGERAAR